MTQAALPKKTPLSRLGIMQTNDSILYGLIRRKSTPQAIATSVGGGGSPSSNNPGGNDGNFIPRPVGTTRVLAYDPITTSINASDEIDISPTQDGGIPQDSSYIILSFADPDTLQLIDGAQHAGQTLTLEIPAGRTLTIEDYSNNATGNIVTGDSSDIVVTTGSDPMIIDLIFDITLAPNSNYGGWLVKHASSGGGMTIPDKIEEGDSSVEVIDAATGSVVTTVDATSVITTTKLTQTFGDLYQVVWQDSGSNNARIDKLSSSTFEFVCDDNFLMESGHATPRLIYRGKNEASSQLAFHLQFNGENDNGDVVEYAGFKAVQQSADSTSDNEVGNIEMSLKEQGSDTLVDYLILDGGTQQIDALVDIDLNNNALEGIGDGTFNSGDLAILTDAIHLTNDRFLFYDGSASVNAKVKYCVPQQIKNLSFGIEEVIQTTSSAPDGTTEQIYITNTNCGTTRSTFGYTEGLRDSWTYAMPVIIGTAVNALEIKLKVITGQTSPLSKAQIGIYDSTTDGSIYPKTLLDSESNISLATSSTIVTADIDVDIEPGLYWLAITIDNVDSGKLEISAHDTPTCHSLGAFDNAGDMDMWVALIDDSTTGSLPSTFNDEATLVYGASGGQIPALYLRCE